PRLLHSFPTRRSSDLQDKLIFARLVNHRGLKDYLEGKISAEQALDSGLALEFAGLKKTTGKGHYDGDGSNKASLSSRKSLAALRSEEHTSELQSRENL